MKVNADVWKEPTENDDFSKLEVGKRYRLQVRNGGCFVRTFYCLEKIDNNLCFRGFKHGIPENGNLDFIENWTIKRLESITQVIDQQSYNDLLQTHTELQERVSCLEIANAKLTGWIQRKVIKLYGGNGIGADANRLLVETEQTLTTPRPKDA